MTFWQSSPSPEGAPSGLASRLRGWASTAFPQAAPPPPSVIPSYDTGNRTTFAIWREFQDKAQQRQTQPTSMGLSIETYNRRLDETLFNHA